MAKQNSSSGSKDNSIKIEDVKDFILEHFDDIVEGPDDNKVFNIYTAKQRCLDSGKSEWKKIRVDHIRQVVIMIGKDIYGRGYDVIEKDTAKEGVLPTPQIGKERLSLTVPVARIEEYNKKYPDHVFNNNDKFDIEFEPNKIILTKK